MKIETKKGTKVEIKIKERISKDENDKYRSDKHKTSSRILNKAVEIGKLISLIK